MTTIVLVFVALAPAAAQPTPARPGDSGFSAAGRQQITDAIQKHIDSGGIPGASLLVARNGRTVYLDSRGVVDAMTKAPMRNDMVVWVASMTKPIVATTLMMMVEQGRVSLDDPVSKFIPEFKQPRQVRTLRAGTGGRGGDPNARPAEYDLAPATREITVRDLLTHTSGIQAIGAVNETIPPIAPGDTQATYMPKVATSVLEFQPGSRWSYSNALGFDVLVRIVEVASGQTWDRLLAQRVFAPLQMTASGFHGVRTDLASRMMPINPQQLVNECVAGKTYFCGSAGLWIPIEDYARFATMLLRGGVAPNGTRLLKAESVKLMATNHAGTLFSGTGGLDGKGVDMGLSVLVVRDNAAAGTAVPNGSFGWDGVGSRRFWVIPAENTVIVMYVPGGMAAPAHRDIEAAVMKALGR